MKHVLASAVLATTLLVACTSTNNATPARSAAPSATMATGAHDTRPAFADHLAPLMEQTLRANAIPGAVVLVEKGGQGRWVESFGTSTFGTHAPLGTNDYFRVGSNTKTMTATVILQLVEEGKVRLDDPVGTYVAGVPNGDQITVEQLLSMRSGLPNYTYDPLFVTDPHKAWQPQELLALSFAKPVNFAPGAQFEYSNTNYILLGLIIEQVTGMPAPEAFERRVLARADPHVAARTRRQHAARPPPARLHVPDRRRDARRDQAHS